MATVNKTHVVEDPSDDELGDGETVESTGEGAVAGGSMSPPSYAELSFFFLPSGAFCPVMWQWRSRKLFAWGEDVVYQRFSF